MNLIKIIGVLIMFSFSSTSFAYVSPHEKGRFDKFTEQNYSMVQFSDKYSCTTDELKNYIAKSTISLRVAPNIMNADQLIEAKIVEASKSGEDSCFANLQGLSVIEDINKLIETINNLDISLPGMSGGGMAELAKAMYEKIAAAAREGVCGRLTKEYGKELVNKIADSKIGYNVDDIKGFSPKDFAKEQATSMTEEQLNSAGLSKEWVNHKKWGSLSEDAARNELDSKVSDLSMDLFK